MGTEETLMGWVRRIAMSAFVKLRTREGVETRLTNLLVDWADQQLAIQESGPLLREFLEAVIGNVSSARASGVSITSAIDAKLNADALAAIETNIANALKLLPPIS